MPSTELTCGQREAMRSAARQAIDSGLAGKVYRPNLRGLDSVFTERGASFVTITKKGELRGCIGTLQACQPLLIDVAINAHKAAFSDPRFAALTHGEWTKCEFSISVLSRPQSVQYSSEKDLCKKLRPGIDGLILSYGPHRATYLPTVWEQLGDPEIFIRELKNKAGISKDFWSSEMCFEVYQSESF